MKKRGLCQEREHCKAGCVRANRPDCPAEGKYWRDENTCVEAEECPCMHERTDEYVKPNQNVDEEWGSCQCVHNFYTCRENDKKSKYIGDIYGLVGNRSRLHDTNTPPAACKLKL